jgi:hypothetical protein
MKGLILVASIVMLTSCENQESVKSASQTEYTLDFDTYQVDIQEYEIDGCQYLGRLSGDPRSSYLTHKGNCTNPIHAIR